MKRVDRITLGKIRQVVEASYTGPTALADLDVALGDNLADERWIRGGVFNIVPPGSFRSQAQFLLDRANGRGWLPDFLAALREDQPGNTDLERLVAKVSATAPASASDVILRQVLPNAILQQVLPGTAIASFDTLERRMWAVCRVDYADRSPPGAGTGFLVGRDLVLTNHHVARRAIESATAARQLRFRFDLRTAAAAQDGAGRCCLAADDAQGPVLRSSPPGGVEVRGEGEPTTNELDYALIRLAEPVAEDAMPAGPMRGFVALTPDIPVPQPDNSIIALQHPLRGELQFAVGTVGGSNDNGSRVRHYAATLEGSSGSLILDVALAPSLLHNGTRPGSAAEAKDYNTGVPLQRIATDLTAHGLL